MLTKKMQSLSVWCRIILLGFLLFQTFYQLQAQRSPASKKPSVTGWQLDATVNGVDFYHALVDCDGRKVVFLKLNNSNAFNVKVSWREFFSTEQVPDKTEGHAGKKELTLNHGEIAATSCTETKNRNFLVLPVDVSPAYGAVIKSFEFKNILVAPIQ